MKSIIQNTTTTITILESFWDIYGIRMLYPSNGGESPYRIGWCQYGESILFVVPQHEQIISDFFYTLAENHPGLVLKIVHRGWLNNQIDSTMCTIQIKVFKAPLCVN